MKKNKIIAIIASFIICLSAAGCSSSESSESETVNSSESISKESGVKGSDQNTSEIVVSGLSNSADNLETSDIFSKRDLAQEADLSDAKQLSVKDSETLSITEEGVYVLTGTAKNCTVKIEADKEAKIQLVLDGVTVENDDFPAIYIVSADKVFITTTDSNNKLSVTGEFNADGDTNTDAVIYSKDDIVFNGKGTLEIVSSKANGISGKDDIKFTGGTYKITSEKDAVEANDSIAVSDGTFEINSSKDGLHSENDEDDTVGYIYISGGKFTINAKSDSIQSATVAQIDGGTLDLSAAEGIESTHVIINGGEITIAATDDGVNGSQKSKSAGTPSFEMNGGTLKISMSGNDTDAIDVNGNVTVNGGTIDISSNMQGSSESFDYDNSAEFNGGTIIINGEQVDEIPKPMMGGGFGGGRGGFNKNGNGGNFNMNNMPEDFDPENLPEDFNKGNFKKFDGENSGQNRFRRGNMQTESTDTLSASADV